MFCSDCRGTGLGPSQRELRILYDIVLCEEPKPPGNTWTGSSGKNLSLHLYCHLSRFYQSVEKLWDVKTSQTHFSSFLSQQIVLIDSCLLWSTQKTLVSCSNWYVLVHITTLNNTTIILSCFLSWAKNFSHNVFMQNMCVLLLC